MFQIIELLSKLIFVPVYYTGLILDMMVSIYLLGDPIDVSSNLIMPGIFEESLGGWMGKITFYEEWGNILQAMPIISALFVFFTIINVGFRVLSALTHSKKYTKVIDISHKLAFTFMELNLIDIVFYATLNLFSFHKKTHTSTWTKISFLCAFLSYFEIVYNYTKIFVNKMNVSVLSDLEREVLEEGLNKKVFKEIPEIKNLNLIFRAKLFLVPVFLVLLQNYLQAMGIIFILMEIMTWGYMIVLKKIVKRKTKLFNKLIGFSNKRKSKTIIGLFGDSLSCASYMIVSLVMVEFGYLAFRLTRFRDDRGTYIEINGIEAWVIILSVLASIFVEIIRMFKQLCSMNKNKKNKKKKRASNSHSKAIRIRIGHSNPSIKVNSRKSKKPKKYKKSEKGDTKLSYPKI
jgi:hypothetical protein